MLLFIAKTGQLFNYFLNQVCFTRMSLNQSLSHKGCRDELPFVIKRRDAGANFRCLRRLRASRASYPVTTHSLSGTVAPPARYRPHQNVTARPVHSHVFHYVLGVGLLVLRNQVFHQLSKFVKMQRGRAARREQNNRVVFERLWRGTFQAVLAGPQRRPRASSHEPNSDMPLVPATGHNQGTSAVTDSLEPALRTIIEGLRNSCCCRCNCSATERNNINDNLQVCLSNDEERKSMRSVIRCAHYRSVYKPLYSFGSVLCEGYVYYNENLGLQ